MVVILGSLGEWMGDTAKAVSQADSLDVTFTQETRETWRPPGQLVTEACGLFFTIHESEYFHLKFSKAKAISRKTVLFTLVYPHFNKSPYKLCGWCSGGWESDVPCCSHNHVYDQSYVCTVCCKTLVQQNIKDHLETTDTVSNLEHDSVIALCFILRIHPTIPLKCSELLVSWSLFLLKLEVKI